MRLSFHGATRTVTGSCHMVECNGHRVLIDCGMLQGGRELEAENADPFGFDAAELDALLLTHAHLDHCGRIPLLTKRGFKGEIIATDATRELTRLVLLDAAHLQMEEQRRNLRHAHRHGRHHHSAPPLYSMIEALGAMDRFGRVADYGESLEIRPGIRATYFNAGHILGSASILLELTEHGRTCRVVFSGDLGASGHPLLSTPAAPPQADIVVMESTYGDRCHQDYQASATELCTAISETFMRGGNVVIPTFALERTQELLYALHRDMQEDRLPRSLQVFLDSPMAISATEIFEHHPQDFGADIRRMFRKGEDPFQLPGLKFTRDVSESVAINHIGGGVVIMAGSGMCTGGRVRHHLLANLWRPESSIIFVGYAATGTLARQIIDGATEVKLWGDRVPVKAKVHTINGFSAHADQKELLAWHNCIQGCERTILVHGEERAMTALAALLPTGSVTMPNAHEGFEI